MLALLLLFTCAEEIDYTSETHDFSNNLVVLDKYFTDRCIKLVECEEESCYIYSYGEGEVSLINEGIFWEYEPPTTYWVEDYNFQVYKMLSGECWSIQINNFGIKKKATACPCPYYPTYYMFYKTNVLVSPSGRWHQPCKLDG